MIFKETQLAGAYVIEVEKRRDERGYFGRTWCAEEFAAQGLGALPQQCSFSHNPYLGTLRGLHCQAAPHEEAKLVRCTRGAIFDVAVDLRPTSRSYGEWLGVELTAGNGRLLWVPEGCAHGFLTLTPDADVCYQASAAYVPGAERGVRWDDPALRINWPARPRLMSDKDRNHPDLDLAPALVWR